MKNVWTILPVVAAFVATPALAQDGRFSGRAEVRAGHDEIHNRLELDDSAFGEDQSENGIGYGVELGADVKVSSSFLVGAYVGLEDSDSEGCSELFGEDEACLKGGRNFTIGGRAGLSMGDGGLIYVKGGYSQAKLKASYFDGFDDIYADSETVGGYHVGAGVEVGLGRSFYTKGEYVYSHYDDAFEETLAPSNSAKPSRHQLMVGFGIRFGATR